MVGADLTALRDAVRAQVGRAARQSDGKFPFTPQAKEALNRGLRVAFLCRDDQVRSAHLLLGLLELREAGTVSVLNSAGVSSETLADVVQEILLKASAEAD